VVFKNNCHIPTTNAEGTTRNRDDQTLTYTKNGIYLACRTLYIKKAKIILALCTGQVSNKEFN